jgi:hypothetical protein
MGSSGGIAAYAAYRWLSSHPRSRWILPGLVAGVTFVLWGHLVFSELVILVGFPRSAPLLGLSRLPEIGVQMATTLAGFRLGQTLIDSIVRRCTSNAAYSASGAPP